MILDSSAVVAIAFDEPERAALVEAILAAPSVSVSAATWLELSIVLGASGLPDADVFLQRFREEFQVAIQPFGEQHAALAVHAWREFGKGNHPARLNFGDCIAYATSAIAAVPLLYVGNDFAQTDVQSA